MLPVDAADASPPQQDDGGSHRLRHTCGAILSQRGADVDTVGAIMGHEKGSPVTQRYMHTSEAVKRRMLEALDREVGSC